MWVDVELYMDGLIQLIMYCLDSEHPVSSFHACFYQVASPLSIGSAALVRMKYEALKTSHGITALNMERVRRVLCLSEVEHR